MYKAIIVDDDASILRGLREIVDWNALGFEIVGTARDGEEGAALAIERNPDLVLTDIKMPYKSGLDMIEECRTYGLTPHFVVLSGFEEFDLARRALKNQVADYLLKPIEEKDLAGALADMKRKIDEGKRRQADLRTMEQRLSEFQPVVREQRLRELLTGRFPAGEPEAFGLAAPGTASAASPCSVLVLEPDRLAATGNKRVQPDGDTLARLAQLACGVFEQRGLAVLAATIDRHVAIVLSGEGSGDRPLADDHWPELAELAARQLGLRLTAGVSGFAAWSELPALYGEARTALGYMLFRGRGAFIRYGELGEPGESACEFPDAHVRRLVSAIGERDGAEADAAVDAIFGDAERLRRKSPDAVFRLCTEIGFAIRKALDEIGVNTDDIVEEDLLSRETLAGFGTLEELADWFKAVAKRIADDLQRRRERAGGDDIGRILLFMNANYDRNIDLELISSTFFIEPSYFCKLFKKRTGVTYLAYLTKLRIDKACEWLRAPGVKVYEIAGRVGYEDQRYFSQLFRKRTGMTPTEYQKKWTEI
ncbi:helix-turn-helix domain-containing protein [Cohnella zeiphila]|uniref:Helix-turn-helix domain-containing protein n=1 Tax=Cohnella zeiphila TaxID=2761120 RepID=A0A7X0SLY3_9BACL|nr:helix-turn-helix domain-containing protein [Cohnella zeiphila]MBB6732440.1 helix-turn-helix domain-containing protein [Cohnella zeiphila]